MAVCATFLEEGLLITAVYARKRSFMPAVAMISLSFFFLARLPIKLEVTVLL